MTSARAEASTFNIQLNFGSSISESQKTIFTVAKTFWESVITGYKQAPGITSLVIAADTFVGASGGALGSAGPTLGVTTANYLYARVGSMNFDSVDLDTVSEANALAIITHEMAHVIGFGTLWSGSKLGYSGYQELYVAGTGQYTGAYGLAQYQADFGLPSATFIPVELEGGAGTANAHWDEANNGSADGLFAGGKKELMTGWLNSGSTVSATTIASFADLGYTTIYTDLAASVPLPAGGYLMFFALMGMGMIKRREQRL
ncbi:leishmanolysin-related zinc metalloendopeptidase [Puniceibacterium sediminis]|uniref:leishmanolysin-related zinc metalloendopeptidase n=1 Tax=Puniceibacterium sediminis TaxID=1608407 RepID=UPI001595076A|nr:leishmanolysin-related zinc metalloendopeptidase [Puniceibacterium sediminis]